MSTQTILVLKIHDLPPSTSNFDHFTAQSVDRDVRSLENFHNTINRMFTKSHLMHTRFLRHPTKAAENIPNFSKLPLFPRFHPTHSFLATFHHINSTTTTSPAASTELFRYFYSINLASKEHFTLKCELSTRSFFVTIWIPVFESELGDWGRVWQHNGFFAFLQRWFSKNPWSEMSSRDYIDKASDL